MKNSKGLACDVMYMAATHARRDHDITNFFKVAAAFSATFL